MPLDRFKLFSGLNYLLGGCGLLRGFSFRVEDAQPCPVLLHPDIRKIAFPRRYLAVPFEDAEGVVGYDRYFSVVINAEAMPIFLHGMHFEHARLQSRLDFGFAGAASIDIRLGDLFGVILLDPIDGLLTAPQKSRHLLILNFHDLFFYRFSLLAGDRLRGNHSGQRGRQQ
jgi:hypothetical protein